MRPLPACRRVYSARSWRVGRSSFDESLDGSASGQGQSMLWSSQCAETLAAPIRRPRRNSHRRASGTSPCGSWGRPRSTRPRRGRHRTRTCRRSRRRGTRRRPRRGGGHPSRLGPALLVATIGRRAHRRWRAPCRPRVAQRGILRAGADTAGLIGTDPFNLSERNDYRVPELLDTYRHRSLQTGCWRHRRAAPRPGSARACRHRRAIGESAATAASARVPRRCTGRRGSGVGPQSDVCEPPAAARAWRRP